MTGCPIAYTDPCSSCAQFGNCAPSQAVMKIQKLEGELLELKRLLEELINKK